ncbi:putative membrane protein YkvI [Bacilli bacterium PM5-3]|nr:putative membrane protein YkvI [Bacilli bacterium PM5-3]MDH6603581.1 putative membrane protein YkvI [Bacilli bacterium PM5-9]
MSIKKTSAFTIAMAFVGTITGAGFASGQELMQFFGDFGLMGIAGAVVSAILFAVYAYVVMKLAKAKDSDNYAELMVPIKNEAIKKVLMTLADVATLTFYFCVLVVMGAGAGSVLNETFDIPVMAGAAIILFVTGAVVFFGIEGVQKGFNISVPVLVVGVIAIAIIVVVSPVVANSTGNIVENIVENANPDATGITWLKKAVEFVFYNTFACFGIIAAIGRYAKDNKVLIKGAIGGAVATSGLALIIVIAMVTNYSAIKEASMPMITLAQMVSTTAGYLYVILMILAIFSTNIGLMFSIVKRVENFNFYNKKYNFIFIAVMCVVALFGSKIGFTQLIGIIYPFYGYISLICFIGFAINYYITFYKKN